MQKSTMISLTAALAACVLSGCFGGIFEPYPFRCNYSNAEGDDVFLAPNPFDKNDESLAVTD